VQEHRRQREIADAVAGAGIGIVALPQTNLYLQGRATSQLVPRAITPIAILLQAGVAVAAGQDNVQDPFNPIGRADPLETASLLVAAAHVSPDLAYELVSDGGRQVLGRGRVAVERGSPADLVAVRASSMREAIAMAPGDRRVFRHGVELD
jgi:cytosine deaminase